MKTVHTLAALALLTAVSGCFVPIPIHDRRDGRYDSWRDDDRGRDWRDRDRSDWRGNDDRDDRRCWNQDGRRYCR